MENGLLMEPKNANNLYEKMKLMVEDKVLYHNYCNTTRISIEKRFEQNMLWSKFLEFYKNIV